MPPTGPMASRSTAKGISTSLTATDGRRIQKFDADGNFISMFGGKSTSIADGKDQSLRQAPNHLLLRIRAHGCPNEAFRIGASASLPDCRAYELVTPPTKTGLKRLSSAISTDGGMGRPPGMNLYLRDSVR